MTMERVLIRAGSKRGRSRASTGFTLVEVLVVIIIVAILAAIAIPSYFKYRENAMDSAAINLVRNGLTVVQSALADNGSYEGITEAQLESIENNMDWIECSENIVTVGATPGISDATLARAQEGEIVYFLESRNRIDLASRSESGGWFGMQVDIVSQTDTGYIKVKVIEGTAEEGW